jgi:hypothetical protein
VTDWYDGGSWTVDQALGHVKLVDDGEVFDALLAIYGGCVTDSSIVHKVVRREVVNFMSNGTVAVTFAVAAASVLEIVGLAAVARTSGIEMGWATTVECAVYVVMMVFRIVFGLRILVSIRAHLLILACVSNMM